MPFDSLFQDDTIICVRFIGQQTTMSVKYATNMLRFNLEGLPFVYSPTSTIVLPHFCEANIDFLFQWQIADIRKNVSNFRAFIIFILRLTNLFVCNLLFFSSCVADTQLNL